MRQSGLAKYFADYEPYHATRGNKACHYMGIPLIMIALLGLLARLSPEGDALVRLDGGTVFIALCALWYLTRDWRIGAPFLICVYGVYFIGRTLTPAWLWGAFALGWVFQLAGHSIWEKKSPAFLKNGEHFLVGPIWIFARLLGYKP